MPLRHRWAGVIAAACMLRVAMFGAAPRLPAVPANGLFVSVNDPHPLKEALSGVEQHYRVAVTFEEAPIEAADEIDDVTRSVSRSPDPAPRVMVARGGPFEFAWCDTATPVAEVLTALVERYDDGYADGSTRATFDLVLRAVATNASSPPAVTR